MLLFYLIIGIFIYPATKIIIALIVQKYGKFSYDGFDAFGFAYDSKKDIFYSTKNAWQKKFGYSHMYDVLAPFGQMIIDTEPIKFYYDNKNWLITFWKGQYGITTGAEIGIYKTNEQKIDKNTLYMPVDEEEMLDVSFVLYKKNDLIAYVNDYHWWLAIFKLGMFSNPKDLTMDIKIKFKNKEMLNAFMSSFKKLHHKKKDYNVENNTFIFHYKKPRTRKVWTRCWLADLIRQYYNRKNVKLYNKYLCDSIDINKVDESNNNSQIILNDFIPDILKNHKLESKTSNDHPQLLSESNVVLLINDIYPYKDGSHEVR